MYLCINVFTLEGLSLVVVLLLHGLGDCDGNVDVGDIDVAFF